MNTLEQAAVLNGIADEFEKLQDVDSNSSGFVIRIRGLQLRATETILLALEARWLDGKPWTERLRTIAKFHADSTESIEATETRLIVMQRNLWLEIVGGALATVQIHADGTRTVTNVRGESLFPTPFGCREIQRQALQPNSLKEWHVESARQARQRSAFICRTIAAVIMGCHPLSPPKEKWPSEDYAQNAIIRLRETPELQKNISKFCRSIADEQGIPEIASSLKKLLYEPEYKRLWKT